MARKRNTYSKEFKAKVALEALKEEKTLQELSNKYGVSAILISKWKKQAKDSMADTFQRGKTDEEKEQQETIEKLYRELGKLQAEHNWLKKKLGEID